MALFGWLRRGRVDERLRTLRDSHLLLVPSTTPVRVVDALLRARVPDARLAEQGRVRLGRGATISGPHALSPREAKAVHVPTRWSVAYAVTTEAQRDAAAFDDIADPQMRAWWMRAFPTGKPYRDEGDAVALALAMARRVGGALRVAGSHAVLAPDPRQRLDLTVWSGFWLDPDHVLDLLAPVLPGARVDLGGSDWTGPTQVHDAPWDVDPHDPLGLDLQAALSVDDTQTIRAVSDQTDAHAVVRPDVVDGFLVEADDALSVEVWQEDVVPEWVRARVEHQQLVPGGPAVCYAVRWTPSDVVALESELPPPELADERERVRRRVRLAALALAEATAGVVTDDGGFEVDRYTL
ncbi:hypothetical protein [Angustibacter aerolatus]